MSSRRSGVAPSAASNVDKLPGRSSSAFASRWRHAFGSDTSRFGSRGGMFISAAGFQPIAFMTSKTCAMFSMSCE